MQIVKLTIHEKNSKTYYLKDRIFVFAVIVFIFK